MVLDDRQLVAGVLAGAEDAQNLFHSKYQARLRATCGHFLGWQDAELDDLVQETFARAFTNLDSFDFRRDLYSWLNKICVNLCFKRLKQRQRLVMASAEDLEAAAEGLAAERHRNAERESLRAESLALVRRAFERLGGACREIIALRDFDGRSYIDIARTLRVAPGTVFSRLARCRGSLKRLVFESKPAGGAS